MKRVGLLAKIGLLCLIVTGFYQCTNDEELFDGFVFEKEFENLQEVHDSLVVSDTIQLVINDPSISNTLSAPKGTQFIFPENSLSLLDGSLPTPPCSFQIVEVYKRGDMIRHNAHTFTADVPLVSGGFFWIQGKDATGAELRFTGANAILPYKTDAGGYENSTEHFTNTTQTTPSGNILSWLLGTSTTSFNPDEGVDGSFIIDDIKSGWNHVAAPFNLELAESTQFTVRIQNVSDLQNAQVFFTLEDFTIVQALTSVENGNLKTFTNSAPINSNGKIVAIALVNGELMYATQTIVVTEDAEFVLEVFPGDLNELNNVLLSTLN